MTAWLPAYIGIGSNLDDPQQQVRGAFQALASLPESLLVARSRLYRTRPFGPVQQGDFINAVAGVLTQMAPEKLLDALRNLETAQGRRRAERWGPRTLDLDLLVFADRTIKTESLEVPHPGIAQRGFVLAPLADVAPDLLVPGVGRVAQLLHDLPDTGIEAIVERSDE
ncbi:MAG: 2-amino-4-hydroxy-6-hydroxymethyldihydropteridine diphosphokinase [Pseudomonadota bacterium]